MYCTSCGKEIAAGWKYCLNCGAAINVGEQKLDDGKCVVTDIKDVEKVVDVSNSQILARNNSKQSPMQIITGVGNLLFGIVLLVLLWVGGRWGSDVLAGTYFDIFSNGDLLLSAVASTLSQFSSVYGLVFNCIALLLLISGVSLIRNDRGAHKTSLVTAISAVVGGGLVTIFQSIMMSAPWSAMEFVGTPIYLKESVEHIMFDVPEFRYGYFKIFIVFIIIAVAWAVLNFVLYNKRKNNICKLSRGVAALLTGVPLFVVATSIIPMFKSSVLATFNEIDAIHIHVYSESVISLVGVLFTALEIAILLLYTFGKDCKYRATLIPCMAVLGTLLLGFYAFSVSLVEFNNIPMEYFFEVLVAVRLKLVYRFVLLAAWGLWVLASAKGYIRAWLQPIIVVCYSVIQIAIDYIVVNSLIGSLYDVGSLCVALLACFPSIVLLITKRKSKKIITQN